MQGDPANVAAHDLGDHAAVVRLTGGPEPVDGFGGDLHGGIETEGVVGGVEVVVHGLGNADDLQAGVGEAFGGREGSFAADGDDGVDAQPVHVGLDDLRAPAVLEGVGAGRAKDGAALFGDASDERAGDGNDVPFNHAAPSVEEPHEFVAVDGNAFEDGAADDGVQSGAVAAAGEDSNFHYFGSNPGSKVYRQSATLSSPRF